MMNLQYDEDFVEAAVFLCVSGRRRGVPALQVQRFHREREKAYSILDPDERNAAFFKLHLEWFREWDLEKLLCGALMEFPLLADALSVFAFRQARGRQDEGAELYVNESRRHAVMALRVGRFEEEAELRRLLRHELMHVNDMIEPAFGYSPCIEAGPNAGPERLVRERYRLLWDVTIDGRLDNAGRETIAGWEERWADFTGAWTFWPEEKRRAVFNDLWNQRQPRHEELMRLATDPKGLQSARGPIPGALCPLCAFPTFTWAEPAHLTPPALAAIVREFPDWTREQGVCGRCGEIYQAQLAPSI
jgi:hypothetical protein